MSITIALAGNPNCGKSTLFNALTGSNQYVGNWPGVTVEKKTGKYKKDKSILITDLPGIYSLSPYTLEEVVARNYIVEEHPDLIVNLVDASNIERNLYLTTQLLELNVPVVIALNMMDIVERRGDVIDVDKLSKQLGCPIVEISALKHRGIQELMDLVKTQVNQPAPTFNCLTPEVNACLDTIMTSVEGLQDNKFARWFALKIFENDTKAISHLNLSEEQLQEARASVVALEEKLADDAEGIITDVRYKYVTELSHSSVKKGRQSLSLSDKIDRVVTNRWLALPIFALVIIAIYYIAVKVVGGPVTDYVNETIIADGIQEPIRGLMEDAEIAPWLVGLVCDGIIAGVGAPIGFLPQIVTLFFLLAILEDVGYMSRIAFILDRIFRHFGLSGKSFIPILVGTGCAIPGIMATRTIESEADRRLTIICAAFLPCGAKTNIIALFAASILGYWWFGPLCYFAGIAAVVITGIILKKFTYFAGEPTPFVLELPEYHAPAPMNIIMTTLERTWAFIKKAGTVIMLIVIILWFLQGFDFGLNMVEDAGESILAIVGKAVAPIFAPLGFGHWIPTVASVAGIGAKEIVVSTMGLLSGIDDIDFDAIADAKDALDMAAALFTPLSAFAFVIFNQLNVPCQGCIGTIKSEVASWKFTFAVLLYQIGFAYAVAFMIYQFGMLYLTHAFTISTAIAFVVLVVFIYLLVRRPSKKAAQKQSISAIEAKAQQK